MAVPGKWGLAASLLLLPSSLASQNICWLMRFATINTRGYVFFLMFSGERHRGCIKRVTPSQKMLYLGQGRTVSSSTPEEPGTALSNAWQPECRPLPALDAGPQHWGHMADTAPQADLTAILENIANRVLLQYKRHPHCYSKWLCKRSPVSALDRKPLKNPVSCKREKASQTYINYPNSAYTLSGNSMSPLSPALWTRLHIYNCSLHLTKASSAIPTPVFSFCPLNTTLIYSIPLATGLLHLRREH